MTRPLVAVDLFAGASGTSTGLAQAAAASGRKIELYALNLVEAVAGHRHDFLFRMLQPHDLARAMSFPEGYVFKGNRTDVVRQIGNAVAVWVATALCGAALGVGRDGQGATAMSC